MLNLHGIRYFTPEDIKKNFPVTLEYITAQIEEGQLDYCLIDGKMYLCEEEVIQFFTNSNINKEA